MGSMDQCLFHQVFTGRAFTSACDSVLFLSFLFFDSCLMVEDFATNGDDDNILPHNYFTLRISLLVHSDSTYLRYGAERSDLATS